MKSKIIFLLLALTLASACVKDPVPTDDSGETDWPEDTRYYANMFAFNMMNGYYLWRDEVLDGIKDWTNKEDPVQKVFDLRYKDGSGRLVDQWTQLMEDVRPFQGSVTGNTKSFGFDFVLYYADEEHSRVCAVVTYTYAGSPASRMLKRGDVILTLDGTEMTPDNYKDLIQGKIYNNGGTVTLGIRDGGSTTITAQEMYEDPVHTARSFNWEGRQIGYLHYTGFTLRSAADLEQVFRDFGNAGVEELVLDLRYNGGGYMTTCTCLASLIAPADLLDKEVFIKEVYNSHFDDEDTLFQGSIKVNDGTSTHTIDALGIHSFLNFRRIWVIMSGYTASASETLICGLKPYMDVRTVGERSHGKFCGGYLIDSEMFYTSLSRQDGNDVDCDAAISATENWGIYVISSRYSDCNGVTLSMPEGIPADYEAHDDPLDGFALGDPSETMLAATLALISGQGTKAPSAPAPVALPFHRPGFGALLR